MNGKNMNGERSVKEMLAAKKTQSGEKAKPGQGKDKDKQSDKSAPPPNKRLASELSFSDTSLDMSSIQQDLLSIKKDLKGVTKKTDLDSALQSLVQKSDIETIVTTIVSKLVITMKQELKQELDEKYKQKFDKQTRAIEELTQSNENLRELVANQRKSIHELKIKSEDNEIRSKKAIEMSNYNEQYSRKFNIKVMNYPEKDSENLRDIFVNKIAKDKLDVTVATTEIQAIHRIPGKPHQIRPIIVKMVNSEAKAKVMRVRKNLPKTGFKLVDDVTQHNMSLITRLTETNNFDGVWYFNGSIYGKTKTGKRMKFNLFDNIEEKVNRKD